MEVVVTKLWLLLSYHGLDDGKHVHLLENRNYGISIALTTDEEFHSIEGTWVRVNGTVECESLNMFTNHPHDAKPYLLCNASELQKDTPYEHDEELEWLYRKK